MFWKKKKEEPPTKINSNEYGELFAKISKLDVQLADVDNRLGLISSIAKSNRARINHLKREKDFDSDNESNKKDDNVVFLGEGRMKP